MTVVDLYTIQIVEDDPTNLLLGHEVDEMMAEAEENLTDLLPAGYRARIRRWDHPDPDEQDAPPSPGADREAFDNWDYENAHVPDE